MFEKCKILYVYKCWACILSDYFTTYLEFNLETPYDHIPVHLTQKYSKNRAGGIKIKGFYGLVNKVFFSLILSIFILGLVNFRIFPRRTDNKEW